MLTLPKKLPPLNFHFEVSVRMNPEFPTTYNDFLLRALVRCIFNVIDAVIEQTRGVDGRAIKQNEIFSNGQATKANMYWHAVIHIVTESICQLSHLQSILHDDVIRWKHFPRYWHFVRGIHWSPVNSPNKGQWRGALMFFSEQTVE